MPDKPLRYVFIGLHLSCNIKFFILLDKDAYILAGVLSHPSVTRKNLQRALKAYEYVRLPFANNVARTSAEAGALYELRGQPKDDYSKLIPALDGLWAWVGSEDPEEQLQRAIKWMLGR